MKDQDHPDNIDHPENNFPRDSSPAEDIPDRTESTLLSLSEPDKTAPALTQRLAEAFREGIASAKPDHEKRPEVRLPSPLQKKDRLRSDSTGTLERVIQEGGSAASVLYDKAAEALDSAVHLAKTAPAISSKWAQAFREGFTSVRPREAREGKERIPYSGNRQQQSGGRGIMDRILQTGGSAAEVVRKAVTSVQPGEARGTERKIRTAEKRIKDLYVEIGHEAVGSWSAGGPVVTERLDELFDELRRNEDEIRSLKAIGADAVAARSAEAVKSRQTGKEVTVTPVSDKEDISFDRSVSDTKLDEHVENLVIWQPSESAEGADSAVSETSVSAAPEAEPPVSPRSEQVLAPEAEPPLSTPAPEQVAQAEAEPLEEASGEADQALPEELEVGHEKTEDTDDKPPRGKQRGIKNERDADSSPQGARNQRGGIKKR